MKPHERTIVVLAVLTLVIGLGGVVLAFGGWEHGRTAIGVSVVMMVVLHAVDGVKESREKKDRPERIGREKADDRPMAFRSINVRRFTRPAAHVTGHPPRRAGRGG